MLDKYEHKDCISEEIEQSLKLSDSVFQKIVTQMGSKNNKVSISNHVLVIDDIASMRSLLQALIQSIGFANVHTAKDGQEAWDLLQRKGHQYGLIISDWEMPKMNGLELLHKIRYEYESPSLPFIIISSTNKLERVQQAIKEGVTDYLTKPITEKTLKDKLSCYIK